MEINYALIEKFAYTLMMANRKLWPYFEADKVVIFPDQPVKKVLQ